MKPLKLALILISLLPYSPSSAQVLKVYINTKDCINCTASVAQFEKLNSSIHIQVFCDETEKTFMPSLLDKYGIRETANTSVSDLNHRSFIQKSKQFTYCEYYSNNKLIFHFNIHDLPQYISAINLSSHDYQDYIRCKIISSIPLSNRVNLFTSSDSVMAVDYPFQMAYFFNVRNSSNSDSIIFKDLIMSDKVTQSIIQNNSTDTSVTTKPSSNNTLSKRINMSSTIPSKSGSLDFQFADCITYADITPENDTLSIMKFAFLNYNNKGANLELSTNWINIDPYMMILNWGYRLTQTKLTTPVFKMTPVDGSPLQLLADWNRSGDGIVFQRFTPIECPVELYKYVRSHPQTAISGKFKEGFYSTNIFPLLYNLDEDRSYNLSSVLKIKKYFKKERPLYLMYDILPLNSSMIMILFNLNKITKLAWIDLGRNELINQIVITTDDVNASSIRFMIDGRLIGFSSDFQNLVLYR